MTDTLHPLPDLLLSAWAQESGIEPDLMRSYVLGELPIPHELAAEIERVLGIASSSWKAVQGPPAIKPLSLVKAAPSAANAPIRKSLQGPSDLPKDPPKRNGKPFSYRTPVSDWLVEIGKTTAWLAAQVGVSRNTVGAWMTGRNSVPGRVVDRVKVLSGGKVGPDGWPKRRDAA